MERPCCFFFFLKKKEVLIPKNSTLFQNCITTLQQSKTETQLTSKGHLKLLTIQQKFYFCHKQNFEKISTSKHKYPVRVCAQVLYNVSEKLGSILARQLSSFSYLGYSHPLNIYLVSW